MKPIFRILLCICALSVGGAGAAYAGPLEDAAAAYKREDYATAMRLFRPLGDQGNAEVQYFLGQIYYEGRGVPQDYAESVKWYRKAADQGYIFAQLALAAMYESGYGVSQDYVKPTSGTTSPLQNSPQAMALEPSKTATV